MAGRKRKRPETSRHHYTKSEVAEFITQNAKESDFKNIEAPSELNRSQKNKFYDLAYILLHFGLTQLDEDVLARYIIARDFYFRYVNELQDVNENKNTLSKKWETISKIEDEDLQELIKKIVEKAKLDDEVSLTKQQDVYFKQMRACAADLGLSISDRGKLIIPKQEDDCEL